MAGRGKVPAIMLYTGDWIKDPELSMCSPSTRGIWIDWLCRLQDMSSSGREPVLKGSLSALARAGRCSETEAISALRELGETGTASVTMSHDVTVSHNEITVPIEVQNRRLSREYRVRVAAASRQRKSRDNRKELALLEASHENVTPPLSSSSSIAYAEEEKNPPYPPGGGWRALACDDFDLFWEALPSRLKTGKNRAREKWLKIPAGDRDIDVALSWLKVAKASDEWCNQGARYAPRGGKIINGQLWNDGTESFEAGNGQKGHREGGRFIPDLPDEPVEYGEPGYYVDKLRRSGERKSS